MRYMVTKYTFCLHLVSWKLLSQGSKLSGVLAKTRLFLFSFIRAKGDIEVSLTLLMSAILTYLSLFSAGELLEA